jgi:hypothetical protein
MYRHILSEPPVLAALIAAFSALGIAAFQFFAQRKHSKSIEELKAKLLQQSTTQTKYLETYLNLVVEGRQQQAQAYASLLQRIQLLRDKMRHFLEQPDSYDPDVIFDEVSEQVEAIVTIYSASQLQFGEVARDVGHTVKNIARTVAQHFEQLRALPSHGARFNEYEQLKKTETILSELQVQLRRHAIEANSAFVRSLESGNNN